MARAISLLRWKYLWVVASLETVLSTLDYGNESINGLPKVPGLTIAGTPVENESFVVDTVKSVLRDSVFTTYDAVTTLQKAQIQHLRSRTTCGTVLVQHL